MTRKRTPNRPKKGTPAMDPNETETGRHGRVSHPEDKSPSVGDDLTSTALHILNITDTQTGGEVKELRAAAAAHLLKLFKKD